MICCHQVSCKILAVLTQYTCTSNYFWMLCEGIYLHTLIIVAVFVGEQQLLWYYILGWGKSKSFGTLNMSLVTGLWFLLGSRCTGSQQS